MDTFQVFLTTKTSQTLQSRRNRRTEPPAIPKIPQILYFVFFRTALKKGMKEVAKNKGIVTIAMLGKGGGEALSLAEQSIIVPSNSTARVQEMHILIGHIFCDLVEEGLSLKK